MSDNLITVYLNRKLTSDEWIWHTGMTDPELRKFWESIEEMWPFCKDIHSLPGKMEPWGGEDTVGFPGGKEFYEVWTAHLHNNRDSALHPPGPIEGRYERQIVHSRYGERDE